MAPVKKVKYHKHVLPPTSREAEWVKNRLGIKWGKIKGKIVVDLGAGRSDFAEEARRRGAIAFKTEIKKGHLYSKFRPLKEETKRISVLARAEHPPFKPGSVDLFVASAVFDKIKSKKGLRDTILSLKDALKKGGEIRADLPYFVHNWKKDAFNSLMHGKAKKEWIDWFNQNGFEVFDKNWRGSHSYPGSTYFVLRKR